MEAEPYSVSTEKLIEGQGQPQIQQMQPQVQQQINPKYSNNLHHLFQFFSGNFSLL